MRNGEAVSAQQSKMETRTQLNAKYFVAFGTKMEEQEHWVFQVEILYSILISLYI